MKLSGNRKGGIEFELLESNPCFLQVSPSIPLWVNSLFRGGDGIVELIFFKRWNWLSTRYFSTFNRTQPVYCGIEAYSKFQFFSIPILRRTGPLRIVMLNSSSFPRNLSYHSFSLYTKRVVIKLLVLALSLPFWGDSHVYPIHCLIASFWKMFNGIKWQCVI